MLPRLVFSIAWNLISLYKWPRSRRLKQKQHCSYFHFLVYLPDITTTILLNPSFQRKCLLASRLKDLYTPSLDYFSKQEITDTIYFSEYYLDIRTIKKQSTVFIHITNSRRHNVKNVNVRWSQNLYASCLSIAFCK